MIQTVSVARLSIYLDSKPLAGEPAAALSGVLIRERLSAPALCEIEFAGLDGARFEPPGEPGASLEVRVAGRDTLMFAGEVTALEYAYKAENRRVLRLRGYDHLHRLRKRQALRAYANLDLAALARELTSDLGITVEGPGPFPARSRVIQQGQSDLDLLAEMAFRYGYSFVLRGTVLHFVQGEGVGDPVELAYGDSLREAFVEINTDATCRTVEVSAWNPFRGERRSGAARGSHRARQAAAEARPEQVGGSGLRMLAGSLAEDDAEAEAIAKAELQRRTMTEVVLRGTAVGVPALRAGCPLRVRGLGSSIDGSYLPAVVVHRFSAAGHVVEFSTAQRHSPKRLAPEATLGVVLDSADPEGGGRVRVRLPAYGDVETDWLSVLSVAAGRGKGLVAVPEPGDRVLVLPLGQDPARSIVVGSLYCPEMPPDAGFAGDGVRRYTLVTPQGQRLCMDDSSHTVRMETQDGNQIDMNADRFHIHSRGDLTIEAPGRAIRIRAKAIDFEKA